MVVVIQYTYFSIYTEIATLFFSIENLGDRFLYAEWNNKKKEKTSLL